MIITTEGIDLATLNELRKVLDVLLPANFLFQPYPAQNGNATKTAIIVRIEASKEESERIYEQAIAATIRNFLKTTGVKKEIIIALKVVEFL
jgi:hypothetical protein